jgi:predicted Zn-ribbon and HTH transcriptional regulator
LLILSLHIRFFYGNMSVKEGVMARVPITVMGFRCERCGHEWIPRGANNGPETCPKCKSPFWDRPRKSMMAYEAFTEKIVAVLKKANGPLTWTEIRTAAGLPQLFPNNQWVHRMEKDVGLRRQRDAHGVIHWQLADASDTTPPQTTKPIRKRSGGKQGAME